MMAYVKKMTKEEAAADLVAARAIRARNPAARLSKCEVCGGWCRDDLGLGTVHPNCVDDLPKKKRRNKEADGNQGLLV
jgi:hypothetical protein